MRIGACGDFQKAADLHSAGFDLIELPVFALFADDVADPEGFEQFVEGLGPLAGRFATYNCFIPGTFRVTGPDADPDALVNYVEAALTRVRRLGGELVVFGSGAARAVPDGYARESAFEDTLAFLRAAGDVAESFGVRIAVEPLNQRECNWINSVDEACLIARAANHPAVSVLSDLYHVAQEKESFAGTRAAGELLAHVHIASPVTRAAPSADDIPILTEFFRAVKGAGYDGRIVLECSWNDIAREGPIAREVVETAWTAAVTRT